MRRNISLIIICLLVLGAGMGLGAFVHYKRSFVTFTVDVPDGSSAKVYADQGGDAPFQYDASKPLFTLRGDQKIKARVGVYDFVVEPGEDYASNVFKMTVNKATTRVVLKPDLSEARLDEELARNKDRIVASLFAKYGDIPTYYTVKKIALYKNGDWAGVGLAPVSDQYDPVRFVLNKSGGDWVVVNRPAVFVLGSLYKNIPSEVVSSVNEPY